MQVLKIKSTPILKTVTIEWVNEETLFYQSKYIVIP